ncbi:ABC transporter ATP-binding protein [Microbacterium sediminicola]|uniref:ABC transporter ATP-binding protein n=1 Tax=Microbacterium sediminicola TaxID=415210 RepID=A0ABP4U2Z8_9MICO
MSIDTRTASPQRDVAQPTEPVPFLRVSDLSIHLPAGAHRSVHAVKRVDVQIGRGERVGIVGESGSGKSVTGRAIAGLLPTNPRVVVNGSVRFDGAEMIGAPPREWDRIRAHTVGMIFQDPSTFLNPTMKIGRQVEEAITGGRRRRRGDHTQTAVDRYLTLAGLSDPAQVAKRFPYELSGGMRQRVLIAIAIAKQPDLIIADEPTTALDATVQRHVLSTLDETVTRLGTSLILISHDFSVVAGMTDRVYVMYAGRVVESGPTRQVLSAPRHPYTQALLRSVRSLTDDDLDLWSIPPSLRHELDVAAMVSGGDDDAA